MEKKNSIFSKFWHGQFRKTMLINNITVLFLHVLKRVAHVSAVCINAIQLKAKKNYQKYKYFDCNIPNEYLV